MAKLSKAEFADRCGMNTRALSVYIQRKKVSIDGDELDDQEPKNKVFLEKRAVKKGLRENKKPESKSVDKPKADQGDLDEWSKLEREKLQEQVEKLKHENRKLKLGNEKTVGSFIPVDHANILILQMSEAIHLSWEAELGDVLSRLSSKFQLTRDEITEIKREKTVASNNSRQRSVKEAKKMLRKLQNETSDKRGVGEHD